MEESIYKEGVYDTEFEEPIFKEYKLDDSKLEIILFYDEVLTFFEKPRLKITLFGPQDLDVSMLDKFKGKPITWADNVNSHSRAAFEIYNPDIGELKIVCNKCKGQRQDYNKSDLREKILKVRFHYNKLIKKLDDENKLLKTKV